MTFQPRDIIDVRGARWRILSVEPGEGCRALRLQRLHPLPIGLERTFLEPFDTPRPVEPQRLPRVVSGRAARRMALALIASTRTWSVPSTAAVADIELLPWQLAAAGCLLRGIARRVLVADAVGLGKTVQAGVVCAETLARSPDARVLILVPAGLRAQWREELAARVGLDACVADLEWVEREAGRLPPGTNPWSLVRLALASQDFAKRAEVLPGPQHVDWSLVVVDEAHAASGDSDRSALVRAVCRRAERVLLLTATPHDGTGERIRFLQTLGRLPGEPALVTLHRRRQDVAPEAARRRWTILRVALSPAERHARLLLDRYLAQLEQRGAGTSAEAAALVGHVLRKRAASSAWALAQTAWRRRLLLQQRPPDPEQGRLPFAAVAGATTDATDLDEVLRVPVLADCRHERAWLGALADAAHRAALDERKPRVLERLVRRAGQPVLVFTEYRDTLVRLVRRLGATGPCEVLHGGQTPAERQRAIDRFCLGRARVLLATDAASEGLNLHRRCRLVVLVDLPWTPTRLEQRIGRIDRLGQIRRVHAVALVGREPFEEALLARLDSREKSIAEALEHTRPSSTAWAPAAGMPRQGSPGEESDAIATLHLRRRALASLARAIGVGADAAALQRAMACARGLDAARAGQRAWVATVESPAHRGAWSGILVLVEGSLSLSNGRLIDRTTIGLHVPAAVPRGASRSRVRALAERHVLAREGDLLDLARRLLAARWQSAAADWRAYRSVDALVGIARRHPPAPRARVPSQPMLFGRYAPAAPVAAETARDERASPTDPADLTTSVTIALLLLRPGPGQAPALASPVSGDPP